MSKIYIDRTEASKILNVSTRTIDRYVKKHNFKIRKDGRRVLIRRKDVDVIIENHISRYVDTNTTEDTKKVTTTALKVKNIKVEESNKKEDIKNEVRVERKTTVNNVEEKVYKELYNEVKKENKEKQERLEAATYRVGQLESQIKTTVPLLDFTRKEKELKEAQIVLEQKTVENKSQIVKMERKLKSERIAKWMYVSLVGLLLVAEPILFLFWAFS